MQHLYNSLSFQSPGRSDLSREDSIIADDSSSIGNKEDDDDDDDDGGDDDKFEGFTGDPERLKAFNVSDSDHFQGLSQSLECLAWHRSADRHGGPTSLIRLASQILPYRNVCKGEQISR